MVTRLTCVPGPGGLGEANVLTMCTLCESRYRMAQATRVRRPGKKRRSDYTTARTRHSQDQSRKDNGSRLGVFENDNEMRLRPCTFGGP